VSGNLRSLSKQLGVVPAVLSDSCNGTYSVFKLQLIACCIHDPLYGLGFQNKASFCPSVCY